jgi:hypothetical protein
MDYLLRLGLQCFEDYSGIERGARLKLGAFFTGSGVGFIASLVVGKLIS